MKDNTHILKSMKELGYTFYSKNDFGIIFKNNNVDNSTFDHFQFFVTWNDVEKFIDEIKIDLM